MFSCLLSWIKGVYVFTSKVQTRDGFNLLKLNRKSLTLCPQILAILHSGYRQVDNQVLPSQDPPNLNVGRAIPLVKVLFWIKRPKQANHSLQYPLLSDCSLGIQGSQLTSALYTLTSLQQENRSPEIVNQNESLILIYIFQPLCDSNRISKWHTAHPEQ